MKASQFFLVGARPENVLSDAEIAQVLQPCSQNSLVAELPNRRLGFCARWIASCLVFGPIDHRAE
jgi:hypothetical protein